MRRYGLTVLLPVTLAGCGWAVPYDASSGCPQLGAGVCASARSVYAASDHQSVVTAEDLPPPAAASLAASSGASPAAPSGAAADRAAAPAGGARTGPAAPVPARSAALPPQGTGAAGAGAAPDAAFAPPASAEAAAQAALLGRSAALPVSFAPDGSVPLRVPSQVMRIWVAPYENATGDLVMPGYVFTDIARGGWQVGQTRVLSERSLKPLDPSRPDTGGNALPPSPPPRLVPPLRNAGAPAPGVAPGVPAPAPLLPPPLQGAGFPTLPAPRPAVPAAAGPQTSFWGAEGP